MVWLRNKKIIFSYALLSGGLHSTELFKCCNSFCGRVPWLYQYWPGGSMLFFVVLCPGTPEGSTGSGSGFKASQKTGQRLKVSSDRLGESAVILNWNLLVDNYS